jgi:hypothetical protein
VRGWCLAWWGEHGLSDEGTLMSDHPKLGCGPRLTSYGAERFEYDNVNTVAKGLTIPTLDQQGLTDRNTVALDGNMASKITCYLDCGMRQHLNQAQA